MLYTLFEHGNILNNITVFLFDDRNILRRRFKIDLISLPDLLSYPAALLLITGLLYFAVVDLIGDMFKISLVGPGIPF
jgi:hypothetical protein